MKPLDPLVAQPDSPDPVPTTPEAGVPRRDPVGELLDHLRAELRQLDLRCCELASLLNDLTIRVAVSGPEAPRRPPKRSRRDATKPSKAA